MNSTLRFGWVGVRLLLVLTIVLGVLYPLLVWGVGRVAAPEQAGGSLIVRDGKAVGSRLIGQEFTGPTWFWARPSAADGDPMASGGSNAGPNSEQLTGDVKARRAVIAKLNGVRPEQVPADAVTASGSGLDPLISPAYAELQINRVAKARGLSTQQVRQVVAAATQERSLGFLGERGVNVLTANLELARLS